MINDIFKKIGQQEVLTPAQKQELDDWVSLTNNNNAFVGGMRNGTSNVNVAQIDAVTSRFVYPPNSASVYTSDFYNFPQNVADSTWTALGSVWEHSYETNDSVVKAYNLSTGKFYVNPNYTKGSRVNFYVLGSLELNYVVSSGSFYTKVALDVKRKSDDYLVYGRGLAASSSTKCVFGTNFSTSVDSGGENLDDLYIQVLGAHTSGATRSVRADIMFFRVFG